MRELKSLRRAGDTKIEVREKATSAYMSLKIARLGLALAMGVLI